MRQRRIPRHRQSRPGRWPRSPPRRLVPAAAAIPRWRTPRSKRIARPPSPAGRHTAATDTTASSAGPDGAIDTDTDLGTDTDLAMDTDLATDTDLAMDTDLATAMGLITATGQVTATGTGTSTGRPVTVTATPITLAPPS
jgi:hypothetical protein